MDRTILLALLFLIATTGAPTRTSELTVSSSKDLWLKLSWDSGVETLVIDRGIDFISAEWAAEPVRLERPLTIEGRAENGHPVIWDFRRQRNDLYVTHTGSLLLKNLVFTNSFVPSEPCCLDLLPFFNVEEGGKIGCEDCTALVYSDQCGGGSSGSGAGIIPFMLNALLDRSADPEEVTLEDDVVRVGHTTVSSRLTGPGANSGSSWDLTNFSVMCATLPNAEGEARRITVSRTEEMQITYFEAKEFRNDLVEIHSDAMNFAGFGGWFLREGAAVVGNSAIYPGPGFSPTFLIGPISPLFSIFSGGTLTMRDLKMFVTSPRPPGAHKVRQFEWLLENDSYNWLGKVFPMIVDVGITSNLALENISIYYEVCQEDFITETRKSIERLGLAKNTSSTNRIRMIDDATIYVEQATFCLGISGVPLSSPTHPLDSTCGGGRVEVKNTVIFCRNKQALIHTENGMRLENHVEYDTAPASLAYIPPPPPRMLEIKYVTKLGKRSTFKRDLKLVLGVIGGTVAAMIVLVIAVYIWGVRYFKRKEQPGSLPITNQPTGIGHRRRGSYPQEANQTLTRTVSWSNGQRDRKEFPLTPIAVLPLESIGVD